MKLLLLMFVFMCYSVISCWFLLDSVFSVYLVFFSCVIVVLQWFFQIWLRILIMFVLCVGSSVGQFMFRLLVVVIYCVCCLVLVLNSVGVQCSGCWVCWLLVRVSRMKLLLKVMLVMCRVVNILVMLCRIFVGQCVLYVVVVGLVFVCVFLEYVVIVLYVIGWQMCLVGQCCVDWGEVW